MGELKPCPFCGSEGIIKATGEVTGNWIGCTNDCTHDNFSIPKPIWNTRPIEDALRHQLEVAKVFVNYILDTAHPDTPAYKKAKDVLMQWCNIDDAEIEKIGREK